MTKIKICVLLCIGFFYSNFSTAQSPTELSFKILNSKDYLGEEIDQLYSYRFKKKLSDRDIKYIATLGSDYGVVANRESVSNESASVQLSFTSKKDSLSATHLYFLFVKEGKKWKFDDYTLDGAEEFTNYFDAIAQAFALYKKNDYAIGTKSKEDIDWQLSNMGPKRLFAKDVITSQHGIAIARALNNNFVNKRLRVREVAYAINYYSPSRSQLKQMEDYLAFASASVEKNISTVKPRLNGLEKELKKAQKPKGNFQKWLDQKAMDWASYGVEYVEPIGFSGYCEGCYDLALVNLGSYRKGLLYVPDKKKLLPLKPNSYLSLVPIKGAWYFYTTY